MIPAIYCYGTESGDTNFGQRAFAYTAPSGFKALCSQNLPTPAIGATSTTQASAYFNTVFYTGNGNNTQSITVGFRPDFIWTKSRSNAYYHVLFDAVRGRGMLSTNNNNTEVTSPGTVYELTSYDSNGFTLGPDYSLSVNPNGSSMVAWNWNAGGTTVTNTQGSVTSQVRANPTAGFSIVTYTCPAIGGPYSVGHGLNATPSMIVIKSRNGTYDWFTWHVGLGTSLNSYLRLNATSGSADATGMWGTVGRNTTVFGAASNISTIAGDSQLAYCWAEVPGYSRFGSYVGNGSADGPFVYTGFRPAFWMMKSLATAGSHWVMYDNKRNIYNQVNLQLCANIVDAEINESRPVDFLSNGVKIKFSSYLNVSGDTYIFAAFAETPFKYARAR
jgi:hypothetical protein